MTEADRPGSSPVDPPAARIGTDPAWVSQRDDFYAHLSQVCLLLLLQERAGSSADLRERLRPLGFELTVSAVDAALGRLSAHGLVRPSARGAGDPPARDGHMVTPEGSDWLREATTNLRRTEHVLAGFLARCSEHLV